MNRRLQERRAQHTRYKQDVARRGKPFYPYAMFHDTVMSLLVVCVIVALACIWKLTTPHEDPSSSGWLGKLYDEKADPGTTNFVPRPDWYFYFLFYLLRIFKWPNSVVLGTVIVPTIALRAPARAAVHRRRQGAAAVAPAGGDGRRDPDHHHDGRAHVQRRDCGGVAGERERRRRSRRGR